MLSFGESYFRLVGLFDWGYTRTQFLLSVSWNWYSFTLAGCQNERSATDPALVSTEFSVKNVLNREGFYLQYCLLFILMSC